MRLWVPRLNVHQKPKAQRRSLCISQALALQPTSDSRVERERVRNRQRPEGLPQKGYPWLGRFLNSFLRNYCTRCPKLGAIWHSKQAFLDQRGGGKSHLKLYGCICMWMCKILFVWVFVCVCVCARLPDCVATHAPLHICRIGHFCGRKGHLPSVSCLPKQLSKGCLQLAFDFLSDIIRNSFLVTHMGGWQHAAPLTAMTKQTSCGMHRQLHQDSRNSNCPLWTKGLV